MANIFSNLINSFKRNKFNQAFLSSWGAGYSNYDLNNETYIEKGYNYNSVIFSIVSKQATKTASIPFYVKRVEDEQAKNRLNNLNTSTKGDLTPLQKVKQRQLESKAYEENFLGLPLEQPNANQTWAEFHYLYKTFMKLFGNCFIYEVKPQEGMNTGIPLAVYMLPAQYMQIVIKQDADLLDVTENPIKEYILTQGNQYVTFDVNDVYHIKYANPNYDESGEHLYGFSPLRPLLRNLQSSNAAIDGNMKILLNNGAFGFIYGKGAVLQEGQVKAIKDRLLEMDNDPNRLGKLSALSAEIGFQRISLTTDELKPFDYLQYDQKQLCNALGYNDKLLNNDDGAKYDNVNSARKEVVTDDIKPDLMLLEQGFWRPFLDKFKGYQNTVLEYDISELPEMQEDTKAMVEWGVMLLDRGVLNRNELRDITTFAQSDDENMNVFTVANDVLTLEEAIESEFTTESE